MRITICILFLTGLLFESSAQLVSPTSTVDTYGSALVIQPRTNRVWLAKAKPEKKSNIEKKVKSHGPKNKSKHFIHINVVKLEVDSHDLLESLKEDVDYLEPDSPVSIDAIPTDPMWPQQWDMVNIAMPSAWDKSQGDADLVVAVFDTGIDLTHPDLVANVISGWSCVGGVLYQGGMDDHGHGTHVAGTIGAVANNGIGISGMNWRIKLMPMKFLNKDGTGWVSDILELLDKAIELKGGGLNIRIGNNSWGGSGSEQVLKDAYKAVEDAGILSVCAAGNSGQDIDIYPFQPAGLDNMGIVSVLATDSANKLASFSNYGFICTDVSAPGVDVLSTVPTNTGFGNITGYRTASGTSMASPHVSGLAALMLYLNENLSVYELKDALLNNQSTDELTGMALFSTTGAKINGQKALSNPLVMNPKTNSPPTLSNIRNYDVSGGQTGVVSFVASDPNFDSLRFLTVDRFNQIASLTNVFHHKTENRFLDVSLPFFVGASDKNGGASSSNIFLNVRHDPKTFQLQDYNTATTITNSGKDLFAKIWLTTNSQPSKDVNFKPYITGKGYNGWNNNWVPIGTGFTVNYRGFLDTNSSYMFKTYTDNYQLAPHEEGERIILRMGTDVTNTMPFPNLRVTLDKISGLNPLVVTYSMTNLANPKTNNTFYAIGQVGVCGNCNQTRHDGNSYSGTITFAETGIKSLSFLVQDHENGENWDVREWKVSILAPTNSVAPIPPPIPVLDAPSNLTVVQTGKSMVLNWIDNSVGEDRYEVEMTAKQQGQWPPFRKVAELPAGSQAYDYSFGVKNSNYQFRTRAGAGTNYSDYSNTANIRFK